VKFGVREIRFGGRIDIPAEVTALRKMATTEIEPARIDSRFESPLKRSKILFLSKSPGVSTE
jgi:hypothetical protein